MNPMIRRVAVLLCTLGLGLTSIRTHAFPAPQDATASEIPGVVANGTKVQLLDKWDPAHGGEGPVATPDGSLLFAQQDLNKILKIDANDRISTYLETANRTTGLAYDLKGRLISAGGVPPQILVLAPVRSVLASTFAEQPLLHPNDLVIDPRGGFYFTDRPADNAAPPPGRKPAVLYLTPGGEIRMATEYVTRPNGIQLSPDAKVLYVADSGGVVVAFDVLPDGGVRNPRNFANTRADGLAMDAAGRLYAAANGVDIFDPQGKALGTIPFPTKPANLAFAGRDRKTLYVVGRGAVYKVQMIAEGVRGRAK